MSFPRETEDEDDEALDTLKAKGKGRQERPPGRPLAEPKPAPKAAPHTGHPCFA